MVRAIGGVGDTAEQIRATVIKAGEGIIGHLLQSGQPELINNTQADPRALQIAGTERRDDDRLMVVPLPAGEAVPGAMAVWPAGRRAFTPPGRDLLPGLSPPASAAATAIRVAGGAAGGVACRCHDHWS